MLKIGMIGLGSIAQKAYLPVISGISDIELHLYTRNETKLKEISQKYRFPFKHSCLQSLINSGISAAFVHSSTESHYEIVKELLNENIHVYVDKPITYHYETAKELVELAASKKLILMTGFNRRFAPFYHALKDVSEPNMIILQKNRLSHPNDIRTFVYDDFIHVIDTVRFLLPDKIQDLLVNGRKEGDKLYHVVAQLMTKSATGIAIMNRDSGTVEEKLEIMGPSEKRLVKNLAEQLIYQDKKETKITFNDWDPTLYKRGFEQIIADFIYAVRTNTMPSITAEDALQTHEICEKIVQSLDR
ncbi:Gfo/Idh/MocA family protein [Neobacillus massiliamazoniensis]|uniref:Gfo/Idh/MocA family oxidoreductase n=1 Tax=Neobacillus massiliamazoniensis TaxID=1499688 RepID=A0A0U1NZM6_9BACI|nr:Gfo/Idh/MocA family oxidoreductase [Neobacillus massiliamazoniensis]CRK83292.1 Gfo/Idh/MocA family oxidoreductase [Neobacillus massiliamazoniensis]